MSVSLPDYLLPFHRDAEKAIEDGLVKDIEFSGPTYQILIEDPASHEEFWVFLQLKNQGEIKDAFCSKEEIHDTLGCLHLAIAYLSLFHKSEHPLHQRFSRSLWNTLCSLFEDRLGDRLDILQKSSQSGYSCHSKMGKVIFSLNPTTAEAEQEIKQILHDRQTETEETSLKFSNLSSEEILSWRQGKPNPQLRYQLSFWCDIAKWLMKKQEAGELYAISFQYAKTDLPNWIQIDFSDLKVGFYLSEANLPLIVESLSTVSSPLKVHNNIQTNIESISYDKKSHVLHVHPIKNRKTYQPSKTKLAQTIKINGWVYVPGVGFYAENQHDLLQNQEIYGDEIAYVLTEYPRLIASLLSNCTLYRDEIPLSYHLHFDEHWNLHVEAYLFEPGDLSSGDSWLIGKWAYLDSDGFYPLDNVRFEEVETVIPIQKVSEFVTQNRLWLNTIEGFHTHLRSIEYQMTYQVSPQKRLTFTRVLADSEESSHLQDFGAWIYLGEHGFYSKTAGSFNYLLKGNLSISPEQIPLFIHINQEELSLISRFFSSKCPIKKITLQVELVEKIKLKISPVFDLLPEYQEKSIDVFDDYVYVAGEGFSELPPHLRLPEKFRHTSIIEGEEVQLFLQYEIDQLKEYSLRIDPQLMKPQSLQLTTTFAEPADDRGRGWYRFKIFYNTELGTVSALTLKQRINKKFPFAFTEAGLLNVSDSRFDWLRGLLKDRFDKKNETILLSTLEFMRLNAFDPISYPTQAEGDVSASTIEVLNNLTQLRTPDQPDITGLQSHLRPYQEIGLQWLWFLYRQQLSGLLCDDMGLGKTHQAMALLTSIANFFHTYAEGMPFHFLIVCPTSVIYHWEDKLKQFLPSLNVCTFHGTKRRLEDFHEEYDVLLTSYGVLRNESDSISKLTFEAAIFDEIQIAKNQSSRIYAALKRVNVRMKVGLTGTPIENYLRELKSLFDIVLPNYFPGEKEYRELFIKPIEKEYNENRKVILNRLIHPFTLRRKKSDVLKDLPEKTEEVSYCDLTQEQHQLYREVLEMRRRHLIENLQDAASPIPYMHIFALLSSLKQICDHPAVYLKKVDQYKNFSSGKWNLFVELLSEAQQSKQKVVVFSQYLGMLDIIEAYLTEHKIGFASLRGSTTNRKEQLQKFNQEASCEVFVGSLQAAGLGIDLTAGSVVIHYDRWWNAARENQATDRVHRIGQTRGVQVFKLVSKDTFEEKIDQMILRKGRLMEDIIGVDDQNLLKTFSRDDLMQLLSISELQQE